MKPIVFLGPTLAVADAQQILDADYRPPARRGDVYQAARERPPLVALVDGVFLATLPPSPLEVFEALGFGVPILGASSLGALRAVELERHGMIGVGLIFQMYRRRQLIADDEVAVVFDPGDLRRLSEPLVNVRYALTAAVRRGIIERRQRGALVRLAQRTYFPERSWPRLFQEAAGLIAATTLDRLRAFVATGDFDLKRTDAMELLTVARGLIDADERCASPLVASERPRVGTRRSR
jgi:hypothetical protein